MSEKADLLFNQKFYKQPRQPSLFTFKRTDALRHSGADA